MSEAWPEAKLNSFGVISDNLTEDAPDHLFVLIKLFPEFLASFTANIFWGSLTFHFSFRFSVRGGAFWFALSLCSAMEYGTDILWLWGGVFWCGFVCLVGFGFLFLLIQSCSYMCVVAQGYCKHIPHRVCKRVWSPLLDQALGCCPLPWSLSSCPLHKVMLAQQQTVA